MQAPDPVLKQANNANSVSAWEKGERNYIPKCKDHKISNVFLQHKQQRLFDVFLPKVTLLEARSAGRRHFVSSRTQLKTQHTWLVIRIIRIYRTAACHPEHNFHFTEKNFSPENNFHHFSSKVSFSQSDVNSCFNTFEFTVELIGGAGA